LFYLNLKENYRMIEKLKLRDKLKFKADLQEFTDYIGCSTKGIYAIERQMLENKPTRYFMYLKKQGFDMNNIFDLLLEYENMKSEEKK
jgi:hypothetical protein